MTDFSKGDRVEYVGHTDVLDTQQRWRPEYGDLGTVTGEYRDRQGRVLIRFDQDPFKKQSWYIPPERLGKIENE